VFKERRNDMKNLAKFKALRVIFAVLFNYFATPQAEKT